MPRPEDHYRLQHGPKFDEAHLRFVKATFEIEQIAGPKAVAMTCLSAAERALIRDRDLRVDAKNIALMAGTDPEAEFQRLIAPPVVTPERDWRGTDTKIFLLAVFLFLMLLMSYYAPTSAPALGGMITIYPLP